MQHISLSIPTPCHEDWNKMLPADKGRFCNACAKQVVDFSTMTDAQVLSYFSAVKSDSVCGRAYPDQLQRTMNAPSPVKTKRWYWNYIALFVLFFSRSADTKAQRSVPVHHQPVKDQGADNNTLITGMIAPQMRTISGMITDNKGNAVANAIIILQETQRKITADKNGNFNFAINFNEEKMVISAIGMESMMITIGKNDKYKIVLLQERIMGKMAYTTGMTAVRPVVIKKH